MNTLHACAGTCYCRYLGQRFADLIVLYENMDTIQISKSWCVAMATKRLKRDNIARKFKKAPSQKRMGCENQKHVKESNLLSTRLKQVLPFMVIAPEFGFHDESVVGIN